MNSDRIASKVGKARKKMCVLKLGKGTYNAYVNPAQKELPDRTIEALHPGTERRLKFDAAQKKKTHDAQKAAKEIVV